MSNSGGTLTLPSPTHPHHHHVDVQAGFRTLRRSLSRSPSKFSLVRTASQSSSDAGSSPSSPSCRRAQSQYFVTGNSVSTPLNSNSNSNHTPSPLATPFRPSVKLSLRSAKSASRSPLGSSTTRSQIRTRTSPRTSPRSPARRALTTASSAGNSTPYLTPTPSYGQENLGLASTRSSASRKSAEKPLNRHSVHLDMSGSSLLNLHPSAEASPLKKRNDVAMNLDQSAEDSPKAKRRSYGPSSLGDNFNIFDHFSRINTTPPETGDDSPSEYEWTNQAAAGPMESSQSTTPPSVPRRAGSLRRSTLQQRHNGERSLTRRAGMYSLSTMAAMPPNSPEAATVNNMNRPRISMDSFIPPLRDGPFTEVIFHPTLQPPTQRHPLSRTITTSSSGSSLGDDSPTHIPVLVEKPRARMNFSKSLPLGAIRPKSDHPDGPVGSMSTPDYKHAKPYEGAFASTGLVSKMIRNPEERLASTVFSGTVPDTPCKKMQSGYSRRPFATYPPPPPTGLGKRGGRFNRHHGSPTTPFGRSPCKEPTRPVLFPGFSAKHSRKGSLLSLHSNDARSPSRNTDEMDTCDEGSMPPTPTKNQLLNQSSSNLSELSNESPTTHRFLPLSTSINQEVPTWQQDADASSSYLDRLESAKKASPTTPQEGGLTIDGTPSSISNHTDSFLFPGSNGRGSILPPATPTTRQHSFSQSLDRRVITPVHGFTGHEVDRTLTHRFGKVEFLGRGEFSEVYKVVESIKPVVTADNSFFGTPAQLSHTPPSPVTKVFAVKKLILPFQGDRDRKLRMKEVDVLKNLVGYDHILQLINHWEENNSLYIQTEFCEEGNLNEFLTEVGAKGRLDDFRIWKITLEMAQGLGHIHSAGFVHRDLKPSNILVGFDGTLKIGDFGLATSLQEVSNASLDLDGDREYLAPEALRSEIDTPVDIFSLGLIMLEIAANVKLPENGATWTALREDDFSEIPVLTQVGNAVQRDAEGMPLDDTERSLNVLDNDGNTAKSNSRNYIVRSGGRQSGDIFGLHRTNSGSSRKTELQQPPLFMSDPNHPSSLDTVVRRMLAAAPMLRFTALDLLQLEVLTWVGHRRRAGATVFEGNWGPGDEVVEPLSLDTEMTDV
ncbi:hypothetical protein EKO27_g5259 [Xylaria grammica]|uniref:Protein kinase domain-containing protein n=1 Tax=Xylaria grammica TaxID=363999 RepID=A0A439D601_9PEZI|nr:hypothetical protein EKO27_g5259 [Xylaria grammica]